jgi:hypothetical protein
MEIDTRMNKKTYTMFMLGFSRRGMVHRFGKINTLSIFSIV